MFADYSDISERLGTPIWFDENGVPRYCEFHPRRVANIYANEAALLSISCQICRQEYIVATSKSLQRPTICQMIEDRTLHYGAPPNANCCGNPHLNSEPRRVLQYWRWLHSGKWQRDSSLEGDIRPSWVISQDLERPWQSEFEPNSACEPRRNSPWLGCSR